MPQFRKQKNPKTLDEKTSFKLEHNYVHSKYLAAGTCIENDPESKVRLRMSLAGIASPDPDILTFSGKFTTGGHLRTLLTFKPMPSVSLMHTGNFNIKRFDLKEVDMGIGLIIEC